jgi:hypothetical protein
MKASVCAANQPASANGFGWHSKSSNEKMEKWGKNNRHTAKLEYPNHPFFQHSCSFVVYKTLHRPVS